MLKIGIDLDDCITYAPEFFSLLTTSMKGKAEIHIVTNREKSSASEENTRRDLERIGIQFGARDYRLLRSKDLTHKKSYGSNYKC